MVAGALLFGLITATAGQSHARDQPAAQSLAPVRMELTDQALAFEVGDDIRLDYRITGDLLAAGLEVLEPEQSAPPTGGSVSTTTTTPEDEPDPPPPPPDLVIQVTNYLALDTPEGLTDVIGADVDRNAFGAPIDGVEIADARALIDIDDDGVGALTLHIGTDSGTSEADSLLFDEPGIHPIRIELILDTGGIRTVVATAGTVVQRLPDAVVTSPMNLALMGAVADPAPGADDVDVAAAAAKVAAITLFAGDVDSPVTAALPPTLVTDQTSTPPAQQEVAVALADDELVSLPAVPLDVSSAAAVDRTDAFARQLRAGEDLLTAAVPTTPTRRDVWIARQPLSAEGAQVLRDLGTRFVVMSPALYQATVDPVLPATDLFVEIALPDGGRLPLLVIDDLGTRLTLQGAAAIDVDESTVATEPSPTELAIGTLAELVLDDASEPAQRHSRVVAAPDLGPLDATLVAELERLAPTTPDVQFVIGSTLTGLTDVQRDNGAPVVVELPPQAGPSLRTRIALLDSTALELASAASMLPTDDPRPAEWTTELDAFVSTAYTDAEVAARMDALRDEADAIRESVVPPEPFTFTLTGKRGEIELPLGNSSDEPRRVLLRLTSPKLVFPEGEREVLLEPGETRVVVPVEARANGTSKVEVELFTPLGEPLHEPVRLTSRVTALTGLGQVLTGGLAVVLLTWWFTHWRARRREALNAGAERHPAGAGSR